MSTDKNNDTLLDREDDGTKTSKNPDGEKSIVRREGSEVGFNLQPRNLKEALKICEYLASSNLVPKQYQNKPQDILVAINWGQEVGLKPLQSLNSIAVVNGTPSMYGAAPLALARQHPEFEWILEDNEAFAYARDKVKGWEHLKNKNPDDTSICVVKRKGEPPVVREFSKDDVKTAGLGNVHKSYPKDMRRYRARSRGLEAAFGDVLKGIHQAEIVEENQRLGVYDDDMDEIIQPTQRETIDTAGNGTPPQASREDREQQKEPESDPKPLNREQVMSEITARAKKVFGDKWLTELKKVQKGYDEKADTMMDLTDDDLQLLHSEIMEIEVEEA